MIGTSPAATVGLVTRMLREAFEGPPGPWTYFTDTAPGTGVFATLGALSAQQASHTGGPGGTTIAGHVHHLSSSLALTVMALRGEPGSRDRGKSWTVSQVDAAEWSHLQASLRRAYDTLRVTIETHTVWDEETLGTTFGAIAHAAYHLGAIRQRLTGTSSAPHR
jgi:hypothetical protein